MYAAWAVMLLLWKRNGQVTMHLPGVYPERLSAANWRLLHLGLDGRLRQFEPLSLERSLQISQALPPETVDI